MKAGTVKLGFHILSGLRLRHADAVCGMRMIWFHTYDHPCVCTLFSFLSERKHPTLTSYLRISQLPSSDFVPVAAWIATWSDSVCRIRSHSQPHDKSHAVSGYMESPSSVYMLFHFCRITHNACRLRLPRIWNPIFSRHLHRTQMQFAMRYCSSGFCCGSALRIYFNFFRHFLQSPPVADQE